MVSGDSVLFASADCYFVSSFIYWTVSLLTDLIPCISKFDSRTLMSVLSVLVSWCLFQSVCSCANYHPWYYIDFFYYNNISGKLRSDHPDLWTVLKIFVFTVCMYEVIEGFHQPHYIFWFMFLKIRLVQDGWEREDGEGQDRSWRQGVPLRGCSQNTGASGCSRCRDGETWMDLRRR